MNIHILAMSSEENISCLAFSEETAQDLAVIHFDIVSFILSIKFVAYNFSNNAGEVTIRPVET